LLGTRFSAGAHVPLVLCRSASIALASSLLSTATAYPLSWLFEEGARWARNAVMDGGLA
jgi:ABC-type spermidine/putrescine transport system permease subunit I